MALGCGILILQATSANSANGSNSYIRSMVHCTMLIYSYMRFRRPSGTDSLKLRRAQLQVLQVAEEPTYARFVAVRLLPSFAHSNFRRSASQTVLHLRADEKCKSPKQRASSTFFIGCFPNLSHVGFFNRQQKGRQNSLRTHRLFFFSYSDQRQTDANMKGFLYVFH